MTVRFAESTGALSRRDIGSPMPSDKQPVSSPTEDAVAALRQDATQTPNDESVKVNIREGYAAISDANVLNGGKTSDAPSPYDQAPLAVVDAVRSPEIDQGQGDAYNSKFGDTPILTEGKKNVRSSEILRENNLHASNPPLRGNRARTVSHDSGSTALAKAFPGADYSPVSDSFSRPGEILGNNSIPHKNPNSAQGNDALVLRQQPLSLNAQANNRLGFGLMSTEDQDEHSSWEFVNHPPFIGTPPIQASSSNQKHTRRRSGGSVDLQCAPDNSSPLAQGSGQLLSISADKRQASIAGGVNGAGIDETKQLLNQRTLAFTGGRDDVQLCEWYRKMSISFAKITSVGDELVQKSIQSRQRQALLKVTENEILFHKSGHTDTSAQRSSDPCLICIFEGQGPNLPESYNSRRKSHGGLRAHLNEYTGLINAACVYSHALGVVRMCSGRISGVRSRGTLSSSMKHTKLSPGHALSQQATISVNALDRIGKVI